MSLDPPTFKPEDRRRPRGAVIPLPGAGFQTDGLWFSVDLVARNPAPSGHWRIAPSACVGGMLALSSTAASPADHPLAHRDCAVGTVVDRLQHGAARAESPALDPVLQSDLDAIRNRDLDRLMATVTAGETLVTLLPNGKKLDGRQAYRDLHVDWFADPGRRMQLEEVHRRCAATPPSCCCVTGSGEAMPRAASPWRAMPG